MTFTHCHLNLSIILITQYLKGIPPSTRFASCFFVFCGDLMPTDKKCLEIIFKEDIIKTLEKYILFYKNEKNYVVLTEKGGVFLTMFLN